MANKELTLESLLERIESLEKENRELKADKEASNRDLPASSETVFIGCNLIQGISLSSPNGDVDMKVDYKDVITLPAEDVVQVLKSGENRTLFVNGLMYFENEKDYERFSIKRKHNINRDVIKKVVLSNNQDKLQKFFDLNTRNKMDPTMVHTIFYNIIDLNIEDELEGMRFETREFIEEYFGMEMKMASRLYSDICKVKP